MSNPTKEAVLALTASAEADLEGWHYAKSGQCFVHRPAVGITVTLRPVWSFKPWQATSRPSVTLQSARVEELFREATGQKPANPLIRHLYQKIWRAEGTPRTAVTFWEDCPDPTDKDRSTGAVPVFIAELVESFERTVLPRYDLSSEGAFLASLPEDFIYHGDPMMDGLQFVIADLLRGREDAFVRYRERVPPGVLSQQADALKAIEQANVTSLA